MFDKILIVCIANICRSPLAEVILQNALNKTGRSCSVSSAGIYALVNHAAAEHSITVGENHGINLLPHKARQLNKEMLNENQLILVMENVHVSMVLETAPFARGRVHRLGKWHNQEITDPYRKSLAHFEKTYGIIEKNVEAWLEKL
ncbi:MAG: low molecular weight protein-tyrosine-phosphatase [Mariprofundaceae bacterium]|nr:low molecular weight protein-tyrosine-phosphatase [Mariprofundaceae bacterium]